MEKLITDHWAAMGEVDRQHHVKLVVDEWGAWHHAGTEVARTHLFGQTSTLRDALIAGLTLDVFNRHADKVAMANVAQLINNLHSLFLAREEKFVATPNFYVFEMYAAHQGGKSLRTVFSSPEAGGEGRVAMPGLAGSASQHDHTVVLTVVNSSATEPQEAAVTVRGATVQNAQGRVLTASDIHAHNTFAAPNAVMTNDVQVSTRGPVLTHTFPPASITRLTLQLA
jgi:alpha-L-arabinofuranosidase